MSKTLLSLLMLCGALQAQHHDKKIIYIGWRVEPLAWTATVCGSKVVHRHGATTRRSDRIHYQDWSGQDWVAILRKGRFVTYPKGKPHLAQARAMRYLTADRSKWSATWNGRKFLHVPKGAVPPKPAGKQPLYTIKKSGANWHVTFNRILTVRVHLTRKHAPFYQKMFFPRNVLVVKPGQWVEAKINGRWAFLTDVGRR